MVLPCDLYLQTPASSLLRLIERHRAHQNLLTAIFYDRRTSSLSLDDSQFLTHTRIEIQNFSLPIILFQVLLSLSSRLIHAQARFSTSPISIVPKLESVPHFSNDFLHLCSPLVSYPLISISVLIRFSVYSSYLKHHQL